MVGGAVLLAVGGAAYGAVKLTQKDTQRIEEHAGASVEELTEEELVAAMQELGIQSIELDDNDRAIIAQETGPADPTPAAAQTPSAANATTAEATTRHDTSATSARIEILGIRRIFI